jgi:two-component system chemotaxis response regulator CheY
VLKQVKEKLPQTVVLMVTASRDRATVQSALELGANGFVLKPFNTKTVIDTIEKALAKVRSKVSQAKQAN